MILDATLAEVDQYLESECKTYQIPGLSAVIVNAQEILWMKAWGNANLELGIPTTVDTRYRICSVTKLFTATMLMQLCEQNRLHLDEPVEKYIPEFSQLHQRVPITYITEHILQPLAMGSTIFNVYDGMSEDVAMGYYAWDEKKQQMLPYHDMKAFTPTGGLYSSARDIAHFLILHLGKVGNGENAILTQQSIQHMRQPILKTEKSRYMNGTTSGGVGIGWFLSSIANTPVVEHGGGDFPFTTFLLLAPTLDLGVFIAANTGSYPQVITRMAYKLVELFIPR